MDSLSPTTYSPLFTSNTPVFGDNAQDLINAGVLNIHPSAIIVVNSIADVLDNNDGVTTLRKAINQANADSGEDLIVFDRSLFSSQQTINLGLGELRITHNLDIIAPIETNTGGDLVTVSGNNSSRVFDVTLGATVNVSGLIVANGFVTGTNGGGILNAGTLNLDSSIVRNNQATPKFDPRFFNPAYGSGISNSGSLTVTNSTISENSGSLLGGGIYSNGNVMVQNSTISGNSGNSGNIGPNGGGGIVCFSDSLTVTNSTISDNSGGGIVSNGNVTLTNSTISGNSAGSGISGSNVTVTNSTISGNSASSGGGIVSSGNVTLTNSTISGNSTTGNGGGISGTNVTVTNSTISNNSATQNGGGIYSYGDGSNVSLTLQDSIINGNSAELGGGIYSYGFSTVTVTNSTISSNSATQNGGGIYSYGYSTVTLTLRDSLINGNSAKLGGGIYSDGLNNVVVQNTTISSNSATKNGGGIYNSYIGTVTLLFSTVTQNIAANGGGVYQNDFSLADPIIRGLFKVRNTIIAANFNTLDGVNPNVAGTLTSNGYNLIGDTTGSNGFGVTGDIVGTSENPIDPLLDSLNDNGGPTQTIALLPGSPAISAADPIILDTDPTTDQRGLPRRQSNGSADIGAFQFSV